MRKGKQKMYLSELFLKHLNGDCSRKTVLRALRKCNDEMLQRLGAYPCAGEIIGCIFNGDEATKQTKQEFEDFWDVYGEFDDMLTPKMKKNYLILQIAEAYINGKIRAA